MGCVYCATCIVNGKKYVGKTKRTLAKRRTQHISAIRYTRKTFFHKAIYRHGVEAFTWETLFESDDESLLYEKEREYIALYNTMVPNGYNLTSGGDGGYTACFSDEWRKKNQQRADDMGRAVYCVETDAVYISYAEASRATGVTTDVVRHCCKTKDHLTYSKLHFCYATTDEIKELKRMKAGGLLEKKKKNPPEATEATRRRNLGRKHSSEFCARRRQIMLENHPWKGHKHTPEALQIMSENRKGKAVGADNGWARSVLCVELNRVFPSMSDAARELGLPVKVSSYISACCRGDQKTACGYHWQYVDSPSIEKDD